MHARYDDVQGIRPFGFTGGELLSLCTWPVNSSKYHTRGPLMGDNIVNISHREMDLIEIN